MQEYNPKNPTSDDNLNNTEEINATNFYKKTSNPTVAIFTMIFKALAIITFLLLSIFVSNDAITMLVVLTLGAVDFWYTKNISGRILVGLRWWNVINPETNEEKWIFESKNEKNAAGMNTRVFWFSIYIYDAFWALFFIWEFIRFNFVWATICFIICCMAFTNTYAFFRCSKQQENIAMAIGKKLLTKK